MLRTPPVSCQDWEGHEPRARVQAVQVLPLVFPLSQGQPPHSPGLGPSVPGQRATSSHRSSPGAWDSSTEREESGWEEGL